MRDPVSEIRYQLGQAAALLGVGVDTTRRHADESGIAVERQKDGPRVRKFSIENIFDIAAWQQLHREKTKLLKRPVIMTFYAPKGGIGKTTTASNLACIFACMGLKVLACDIDSQANLTSSFGYDAELTLDEVRELGLNDEKHIPYHFGHLMPGWPEGRRPLCDVIKKPYGENGPHLVPADIHLDNLDTAFVYQSIQGTTSDKRISQLIVEGVNGVNPDFDLSGYDIIMFDAAPAKNKITRSALLASDFVVSPVAMERFSTKSISFLASLLQEMNDEYGRFPNLLMLTNFYVPKRPRIMMQQAKLAQAYPGALLASTISRSEEFAKLLSESDDSMPPLALSKPAVAATRELREVATELLVKMGVIAGGGE